jgi:hypothetical protein
MNDGVTMQGNTSGGGAMASALEIRGTAIINGGTIKNCVSTNSDGSSTIYLGSNDGSHAHLTINGGSIIDNEAPWYLGGSIMVNSEGPHTLIWNGGTITGNTPNGNSLPDGYGSIYVQNIDSHTIELNSGYSPL